MKTILLNVKISLFFLFLTFSSFAEISTSNNNEINNDVKKMATDFIDLKPMRGFKYQDISLSEAYDWQKVMADYLGEELGPVVGYKTGGHNEGPSFPTFPPEGIRGLILKNMILPSNSSIKVNSTMRGFLEADFALRVRDHSINSAKSDEEILLGLDAIIPFAEVPDPHYESGTRSIYGTVVSNMGSRFSFVGKPIELDGDNDWLTKLNNFTFAVHDEYGNTIDTGQIKGWYEPIKVVRWLRDHLLKSGIMLKSGDLISLGNIGIIRQIHPNSPRGPAYKNNSFVLSYYGLSDDPVSVIVNLDRTK